MTDLGTSDAEDYAQDFRAADSLREFGVETGSALLDEGKVKARGIGDRLNEVGIVRVSVSSGNRRMLPNSQGRNGLSERVAEIGILSAAAVASPPARIHRQLHQVGEPSELVRTRRFAAG